MINVKIIKNWDYPDIFRQSPNGKGVWDNILFFENDVEECDYAVVLNHPEKDTYVICDPDNIWAVLQEPPNKNHFFKHQGDKNYSKVINQESLFGGKKYILNHGALPWHINRSYDELTNESETAKTKDLSCIVSNKTWSSGHIRRLNFVKDLKNNIEFDLFGKGINELEDKYDGLAPYKYSIAIENFSNNYYWTEKIADCYLTRTVPFYFGCNNIGNFFPENSFVWIDIDNIESAANKINETINSGFWEQHLSDLEEARELVLNKYNFFPFIADKIKNDKNKKHSEINKRRILLTRRLRQNIIKKTYYQIRFYLK